MERSALGGFIRTKRLHQNISEREFAILLDVKPSQWNRIERGLEKMPEDVLLDAAKLLKFESDEEIERFMDLVMQPLQQQSKRELTDQELLNILPVCFRTNTGKPPTREQMLHLAEMLRENLAS